MTLIQLDLNDRSVRNEVLSSPASLTLPGSDELGEKGAEESVMLGERWCVIVRRPGLSDCDWAHPLLMEGQGTI